VTTGDLFHRLAPYGSDSGATFSACRKYRYRLWRAWGDREKRCCFIGLNPSTADELEDDPTIRKCIGFAKRWGFGAYDMLNLFGWRSTNPLGLLTTPDPIGPENRAVVAETIRNAKRVVLAWGSHDRRVRELVRALIKGNTAPTVTPMPWGIVPPLGVEVGTLGRNDDGSPKHPLMLAYALPFQRIAA
jgi:hypothetical protein